HAYDASIDVSDRHSANFVDDELRGYIPQRSTRCGRDDGLLHHFFSIQGSRSCSTLGCSGFLSHGVAPFAQVSKPLDLRPFGFLSLAPLIFLEPVAPTAHASTHGLKRRRIRFLD